MKKNIKNIINILLLIIFFKNIPLISEISNNEITKYAPIVIFESNVKYYPTSFFKGNFQETCCYVNIKKVNNSIYIIQYWFFYIKDIRLNEIGDNFIKNSIKDIFNYLKKSIFINSKFNNNKVLYKLVKSKFFKLNNKIFKFIDRLFHNYDWELIEVEIKKCKELPNAIIYHYHGSSLRIEISLYNKDIYLKGFHPIGRVLTDMHGVYPPNIINQGYIDNFKRKRNIIELIKLINNFISNSNNSSLEISKNLELFIYFIKEFYSPYKRRKVVNYSTEWKFFSNSMLNIHILNGYPHPMPWDRNYNY